MSSNKWINTSLLVIIVVAIFVLIYKPWETLETTNNNQVIRDHSYRNININTANTKVEIVPTKRSETTVTLSGNAGKNSRLTLDADVKGDTLAVEVKRKRKFSLWTFNSLYNMTLTVNIPEKQYDSITVHSKNGRIELDSMLANQVRLESKNGRISLGHIEAESIHVDTKNGAIELINIDSSNINADTKNGKLVFEQVNGDITGTTKNGRISLVTDHLNRSINLDTKNGQIEIKTSEEPTNAVIDAKTSNGRINVFGQSNSLTTYGDGENLIKLRTKNGRINVVKK